MIISDLKSITCLFHSLGKFAQVKDRPGNETQIFVNDVILYIIYEEFNHVTRSISESNSLLEFPNYYSSLVATMLGILITDIAHTEITKKYIGPMFKKFVQPWMHSNNKTVQNKAVLFYAKWLPVRHDGASVCAIQQLIMGLQQTRNIHTDNFDLNIYESTLLNLSELKYREQCAVAIKSKLLRQIMQPFGTVSSLDPIPGCPGFFIDSNSSLQFTKSVLVELPVHPESNVTITRLVPGIPGVPKGFTTTPPLYLDTEHFPEFPVFESQYHFLEATGRIAGLPPGYTYQPSFTSTAAPSQKIKGSSSNYIYITKNQNNWITDDDIPDNTSKKPIEKLENSFRIGLSSICSYAGFDPTQVDKKTRPLSAVYDIGYHNEDSPVYTFQPHPILLPSKLRTIKTFRSDADFLINSKVVLDIIQPQNHRLQSFLVFVKAVNVPASEVRIQQSSTIRYLPFSYISDDILVPGYTFNIYVRSRTDESKWTSIQLEIITDNYTDDIDYANPVANAKSVSPSSNRNYDYETFSSPFPAEWNERDEPLFMPHVNLNPLPCSYNESGLALYGKTSEPKIDPLGLTLIGTRYYARSQSQVASKNMIAGYDLNGNPFYISKYYKIPDPVGFTVDGIPFYDAGSLIIQKGTLINTRVFKNHDIDENDSWEDLLIMNDFEGKSVATQKRLEKVFVAKLCKSLKNTQPKLMNALTNNTPVFHMQPRKDWTPIKFANVQDPPNIQEYLIDCIEVSHRKFNGFRVLLDPPNFEFCSVNASTTKTFSIRFRANRGDHEEREVFVSTDSNGVFHCNVSTLRLSGEGVISVDVVFSPNKMAGDIVKSGLYVLNHSGIRIASSALTGRRQGFFTLSCNTIDAGWAMPERQKSVEIKLTNHSGNILSLGISLKSESQTIKDSSFKRPSFKLRERSLRLLPYESKLIPLIFYPCALGYFTDVLSVVGPGGDVVTCKISGTGGIPIAIYPEVDLSSSSSSKSLTEERTAFISKYDHKQTHIFNGFSAKEIKLLKLILSAQADQNNRKEIQTIDFGLCSNPINSDVSRFVTFFNLGDESLTISVHSHSPHLKVPYLLRIPAKSARTVTVKLFMTFEKERIRGNFNSMLEVACSVFENLPIYIKGFFGQAVYFPVWEHVFFKPCRTIGEQKTITLNLINESQYDLKVSTLGLTGNDGVQFRTSLPNETDSKLTVIPAFGLIPVTFYFIANQAGMFTREMQLQIHEPYNIKITAVMRSNMSIIKHLQLYGICIDSSRDPENCLNDVIRWIGNIGRAADDEPHKAFKEYTQPPHPDGYDVEFKTDPFISEIGNNFALGIDQCNDSLAIQNNSQNVRDLKVFGSTSFNFNPQTISIHPGDTIKIEHLFSPPFDIARTVTVYGFVAVYDEKSCMVSSTQLVKRMSSGLLVLPLIGGDDRQISMDFGNIELTGDIQMDSTKYLMLCNPHNRSYRWKIKSPQGKPISEVFEMLTESGIISAFETFTITFKFTATVSGRYEHSCEIIIFDLVDRKENVISSAPVALFGSASMTSLTGVPEFIEFNNTLINTTKKYQFTVSNSGTVPINVKTDLKIPFTINSSSITISPKSKKAFEVSFTPQTNKYFDEKLHIFANQHLFLVPISGFGGTARLESEKYTSRPVCFGTSIQSTICWTSVYLTNFGSLPIILVGISSTSKSYLLKAAFVETVNSVPLEIYQIKDFEQIITKRDYWGLLRQKIKVFNYLKPVFQGSNRLLNDTSPKKAIFRFSKQKLNGKALDVQDHSYICYDKKLIQEVPPLKPQHSYHLKIGFKADMYFSNNYLG